MVHMSKLRALLVVPFAAIPTTSGGGRRVLNTIEQLSKKYDLEVWGFSDGIRPLGQEKDWLKKVGVTYRYFNLGKKNFITSLLYRQPYWFTPWWNSELIQALDALTDKISLVQIDGTQLLYLANHLKKSRRSVFVSYDVSTISFWRRISKEKNIIKRILQLVLCLEIYLYEVAHMKKFSDVVSVSEFDANLLKKYFRITRVNTIPNGIEQIKFLNTSSEIGVIKLGYIGGFSHPPNVEAVRFIIQEILPVFKKEQYNYKLILGGEVDKSMIEKFAATQQIPLSRIVVLDYVINTKDFYKQIDVLVAPLFSGSGTKIKIMESLSFGRPVVTTTVGAEGIKIISKLLTIVTTSQERNPIRWHTALRNVIDSSSDPKLRASLKLQLENYTWQAIFKIALSSFY